MQLSLGWEGYKSESRECFFFSYLLGESTSRSTFEKWSSKKVGGALFISWNLQKLLYIWRCISYSTWGFSIAMLVFFFWGECNVVVHERWKFLKFSWSWQVVRKDALHVTEVREHESSGGASQVAIVKTWKSPCSNMITYNHEESMTRAMTKKHLVVYSCFRVYI